MRHSLLAAYAMSIGLCACATQRAVLPEAPRQWWVHVWVGTPKSVFWVQLDETGSGDYWASDAADKSSEGKVKTTAVISQHIYDSVRRRFSTHLLREAPMLSVDQLQKMRDENPFYTVSFTVRVGQQQLSFDTPLLKSLDAYPGLRPIVVECVGLLPEDTRKGIDLEQGASPNRDPLRGSR